MVPGALTTTYQGTLMKTSVMQAHDMLSVFSVDEVEKRIGEVPGVESVTVNFAAGNATVRFDETRLEIADIKSAVRQRGFEPAAPVDGSPGDDQEGHAAAPAATVMPASSSTPPAPTTASATESENAASSATPDPASDETPAAPAAAEGDSSKEPVAPEKS